MPDTVDDNVSGVQLPIGRSPAGIVSPEVGPIKCIGSFGSCHVWPHATAGMIASSKAITDFMIYLSVLLMLSGIVIMVWKFFTTENVWFGMVVGLMGIVLAVV